ncbi:MULTISPECIES: hypothetical protein [Flavobacterium]|uniref:Uncharacterized protein n=1 Tax=Flavobacterium salmonis TaxID=2654844 RepID=A0A6V6Z1D6_9FLAO|nr:MULTISPECIES: hypothetical protein [Flavobacterium]OOV19256.1 hypothetical protein BXU10_06185 [Flavobacterium sp. LM4]CAD0005588.1 hypothetical protein FLAT13_02863 [Flavobacterium salmonis]
MKRAAIVGITVIGIFLLFFGAFYIFFINIDFVGHKDPKTVKENLKRENNKILSAEYRNGTDYCKIDLLDKANIEINVGNSKTGIILNEKYHISGDTIIIEKNSNEFINEDLKEYMNTDKFIIADKQILFEVDKNNQYNKSKVMEVKFNEIHQK